MGSSDTEGNSPTRQTIEADIACVGFGPGTAGFLCTLAGGLAAEDGTPKFESRVSPGMPPQILCYERADDMSFGVSGIVTRGRAIRATFPGMDLAQIPMTAPVGREKLLYLLDPVGASRRSAVLRVADTMIKLFKPALPVEDYALSMPLIPSFMRKDGGLVTSMGQLCQFAGTHLMGTGLIQLWPGSPVAGPLFEGERVAGLRLLDQGVDKQGNPESGFMPGMDVRAGLTVLGDGPVSPVSRKIDERLGLPAGRHRREWALGMKMLVQLPADTKLAPGTVFHTFGYPEPEIFGFLYVYPEGLASLGIFVPSWFKSPVRTAYRYLQHWMLHPYLWKFLKGAEIKSWGAKSLLESGQVGEPFLAGEGYVRLGEGSGSTNVLSGSGVDEAWMSGTLLAEGVLELMSGNLPFTKENLEMAYVARRRESWLEKEAGAACGSRDGFQRGVVAGMAGMMLAGLTGGRLRLPGRNLRPWELLAGAEEYFKGVIPKDEIARLREECSRKGTALHDAFMDRAGWPAIEFDGRLLVSHQDVLLMGGKVQAASGYADHVRFVQPELCRSCRERVCIEMCSGQAITPGEGGVPAFDREKCVHCGACMWNCSQPLPDDPERMNIEFNAGSGGLHSSEN